jgi:outer membrane receptor protein involved in Fe transport
MVQPPVPDPTTGRFAGFTRDDGFDATTWSAFAELSWDILPTLELAGGARWTHEKKDSYQIPEFVLPTLRAAFGLQSFTDRFRDSNVSPQATLTWRPDTDHTYYVAYKEGFKSGGYNLSQTITAGTRRDDGSFKSEKAKGFEAGARTTWMNGALLLNATVYDYKYTDLQVQVFDALTSAQRVNNVGSLTVKGIEGQAVWRDAGIEGFDLNADVAYNHARFGTYANASCYTGQTVLGGCNASPGANGAFNTQDLSGRTPPKAPRWAGRIGASYTAEILGDYTLNLSGDARYSSKYNFTDALRPDAVQKGYTRFDATVRLSPRDERWTIALIGRNLTEKWVVSSANDMPLAGGGGTGTPAGFAPDMNTIVDRGRQVYLELSTRF